MLQPAARGFYRPPSSFFSGGGGEFFPELELPFEPDAELDLPLGGALEEPLPEGCDRVAG